MSWGPAASGQQAPRAGCEWHAHGPWHGAHFRHACAESAVLSRPDAPPWPRTSTCATTRATTESRWPRRTRAAPRAPPSRPARPPAAAVAPAQPPHTPHHPHAACLPACLPAAQTRWGHEFIEFEFRPDGRVRGLAGQRWLAAAAWVHSSSTPAAGGCLHGPMHARPPSLPLAAALRQQLELQARRDDHARGVCRQPGAGRGQADCGGQRGGRRRRPCSMRPGRMHALHMHAPHAASSIARTHAWAHRTRARHGPSHPSTRTHTRLPRNDIMRPRRS